MRKLTSHKVNGLNEAIDVEVMDEPGTGGANHRYQLVLEHNRLSRISTEIVFQNGAIGEVGFNGISNEALLAIVEDRLKGFQSGKFSCCENALALTHIQDALHCLHHRTRERVQRGVEGTLVV